MAKRGAGRVSAAVAMLAAATLAALIHDPRPLGAREAPIIGETERVVSLVRGIFGEITRELVVEDEVYSQEIIETGSEGATRIVFLDGTELTMGPHSRVTLDHYVYDPATGIGALAVGFISGIFEFASGLIPAGGYDLRTPFANIAIRGTEFILFIDPLADEMQVAVQSGEIATHGYEATIVLTSRDECLKWTLDPGLPLLTTIGECASLLEAYAIMTALLGLDVEPGAPPEAVPIFFEPAEQPTEEGLTLSIERRCELAAQGLPFDCPTPH